MVQIWFPGLKFNGAALTRGQLLDVTLLGVGLVIPPWDITFLPAVEFWKPFLIFDSNWVVKPITDALAAIPKAIFDAAKGILDGWAAAFYESHCTYEEYMREKREQEKQ